MGPTAQGAFNLVKAEVDFLTALLLFGLPQSLFYFLQKNMVEPRRAIHVAFGQSLLALFLALAWTKWNPGHGPSIFSTGAMPLLVALAVAAAIAFGSVRGMVLAIWPTWAFAIASAAPSVLLLCGVVAVTLAAGHSVGDPRTTALLLFFANSVCLFWVLLRINLRTRIQQSPPLGRALISLARYGIATWIPTVCQSATVLLALRLINRSTIEYTDTGIFAAALALVAVAVTPVNLAAPVLFKQWTSLSDVERAREFRHLALLMAAAGLCFIFVIRIWGQWIVGKIFGAAYVAHIDTFATLSLIIVPQCLSKLWGVLFSSSGTPAIAALIDVCRLSVFATLSMSFGHSLPTLAMSFVAAEYVSLVLGIIFVVLTRRRPASLREAATTTQSESG
jgi:O-antigen/teichoic acid export membrane protein